MRDVAGEKVCVVGGAGFLGSHLVNYLIEEKQSKVVVIDNLITGRKDFVHPDAEFEYADITGSESYLRRIFEKHQARYVFNYAAEPYIPVSFERPLHVFDVNAFGALKVINAAHESGVEAILQVSSAEIYGGISADIFPHTVDAFDGRINEGFPVTPHSSYGAAKAAIDSMVQVRWREKKVPVISLRQFNCLGERETHPYIVPEIISQLASITSPLKKTIQLGNNSFRDFQYAGDAVRMAVELLEEGDFGEVYNMGSESGVKMYDLAKEIGEAMGFFDVEVVMDPERCRPWEIWHLLSDNSKLYSVIESRPTTERKTALQRTVDWYASNGYKWAWE